MQRNAQWDTISVMTCKEPLCRREALSFTRDRKIITGGGLVPKLTINVRKIEQNAALVCQVAKSYGIEIFGVAKGMCGPEDVGRALVRGGCVGIGDSQVATLKRLKGLGLGVPLMLLRLPTISRVKEVVQAADISLNSEFTTCEALSAAAGKQGLRHKVLLMVDIGDLREGVWPGDLLALVQQVSALPHVEIYGVGANLACFGGIVPEQENLELLLKVARQASEYLGKELVVSGGNSSSLKLLFSGKLPLGINNLRIGEGILLGREAIGREPLPGAHLDTCVLTAEVIELKEKPSRPIGTVGQDAFGNIPNFVDRGIRRRAILNIGRQDVAVEGLVPRLPGALILGASSDHLVMDVHDSPPLRVGDQVKLDINYGALLAASTSPYVKKEYVR